MALDPEKPSSICHNPDSVFYETEPCECASCKFTNDSHRCVDDPCNGCEEPTVDCGISEQIKKEERGE